MTCCKCQGMMKIISLIEDEEIIEKIQIPFSDSFYVDPDYPMDSYPM